MQRICLPFVIRAVVNTDPTFVQIKFEQCSDSVVCMDIRTDLAEVFKADRIRFNKSVGEGFGVGRQLTALIETVSIRSLQRCAEIVACEVTVFTVFTDVVDRKAAICFKSCFCLLYTSSFFGAVFSVLSPSW